MWHTVVTGAPWKAAVSKKNASLQLIKRRKSCYSPRHTFDTCFSFCSELPVVCGDLGVMKHFECTTEKLWQQSLRVENNSNNNNNSTCVFMEILRRQTEKQIQEIFSLLQIIKAVLDLLRDRF